jgi:hypothetical protein
LFLEEGKIMMTVKSRINHFLIIISAIIVCDFVFLGTAESADNTQIIIDENLKSGMALKDAIELLGPPETIKVSNNGTVVIPYDTLGLSIEMMNNGTTIEAVHVQPSFKGRFASGIQIGADYQKILSTYNQPDIMTKENIEYFDQARIFQIHEGKLSGADLYAPTSTLYHRSSGTETVKNAAIAPVAVSEDVPEGTREALRQELREEVREEVRQELREEVREEVSQGLGEDVDIFDLYGFKVRNTSRGIVVTEIRPGSVAERGDLKTGEPIRKVFYGGAGKLNIYSVKGLEKFLRSAINKNKKTVNILQDKNYYYKVEVPEIKQPMVSS